MKTQALKSLRIFMGVILFGSAAYVLVVRPNVEALRDKSRTQVGRERISEPVPAPEADLADADSNSTVAASSPGSVDESRTAQLTDVRETSESNEHRKITAAQPNAGPGREPSSSLADASSQEEAVHQPVAFAEDSPNPSSSAEEIAEISALRQQFVEEIGGYNQDPSDPEYRRRWREAQQLLDEQLRTQIGEEVFDQLQNEGVTGVISPAADGEQ